MPRRIHLTPHLTDYELQKRYRRAADPVERSRWQFLWLLAGGLTATAIARALIGTTLTITTFTGPVLRNNHS